MVMGQRSEIKFIIEDGELKIDDGELRMEDL